MEASWVQLYLNKFDNDFFGESELLEKTPRKSTAMAIEKSLLYRYQMIKN